MRLWDDSDFKNRFTPKAVQAIHEFIVEVWPDIEDLKQCLSSEENNGSALYVGIYTPQLLFRGVTRHSLYNEQILLVDPFIYPLNVKDEYNPILHPEKHIANTIKSTMIWFTMLPWIEAGLVKFIRTPGDFDTKLLIDCIQKEREKYDSTPEIREESEKYIRESENAENSIAKEMKDYMMLSIPDDELRVSFKERGIVESDKDIESLITYVNYLRDEHPYFIETSSESILRVHS